MVTAPRRPQVQHRRDQLQQRRLRAAELFAAGVCQAVVARQLGVSRQAASRWHGRWKTGGPNALRSRGPTGPTPRLSDDQLAQVEQALKQGATANGSVGELWTLDGVSLLSCAFALPSSAAEPAPWSLGGTRAVNLALASAGRSLDGVGMPDPQPQAAPPTKPASEPSHSAARSHRPTSLAPLLAPGGLAACQGVHRSPVSRAGQTARPGSRRRRAAWPRRVSSSPATSPTTPTCATPRAVPPGRRSGWRSRAGVCDGEQWREGEPAFYAVVVWRDQAEHAAASLANGSRAVVVGRLAQRSCQADDGSTRSLVEVVADELGPGLR